MRFPWACRLTEPAYSACPWAEGALTAPGPDASAQQPRQPPPPREHVDQRKPVAKHRSGGALTAARREEASGKPMRLPAAHGD